MSDEDKTISDQLSDLRQLISTSFQLSRRARDLILTANDGVQKSCAAASAASEALNAITTKLGLSVPAPERVAAISDLTVVTSDDLESQPEPEPEPEPPSASAQKKSCKKSARPTSNVERDLQILALRDSGLSFGKIARRVGMTPGAVWSVVSRGVGQAPATAPTTVSNDAQFNLGSTELSGITEKCVVELFKRNYPAFTSAKEIVEVADLADESVASPTITRIRQRGVAIESAQQARRQGGEPVPVGVTGWRLIAQ